MEYTSSINAAIEFIEEHLFESFSPAEVAAHIGFSEYHFHRIFQGMLGESMAVYIRNRRLSEAAKQLKDSDKAILEIALQAGFENHESFIRAFKRVYGSSSSHYRKCASPNHTIPKNRTTKAMIEHLQTGINLEPKFEVRGPILVVGMAGSFKNGSFMQIGQLWDKFSTRMHEVENVKQDYALGVCMASHPDVPQAPEHTMVYMAGLPVESIDTIPDGMTSCAIPRANYAVFTHKGSLDKLPETINYIWGTWIPKNVSTHHHGNGPDFELYDARFDPATRSGEFDIYVPVEPA